MIELKPGVRLHGIVPQLVLAVSVAEGIWMAAGAPTLVVTAGIEGAHMVASDHYRGEALDFRTKNLPPNSADTVRQALQAALGEDFVVLLELKGEPAEHIHCSWRPKAAY